MIILGVIVKFRHFIDMGNFYNFYWLLLSTGKETDKQNYQMLTMLVLSRKS